MKDINWFKYRQYLGYAIDLGRIFPLLSKQKGWTKFLAGILLQVVETLYSAWIHLLDIAFQINYFLAGLIPSWIYENSLNKLPSLRLEATLQLIFH